LPNTATLPLRVLVVLVVLAIAAWLRWVSLAGTEVEVPIRADASEYVAYAYNLKHSGVYSRQVTWRSGAVPKPDRHRPPGYPLLMLALLDDRPDPAFERRVRVVQAVVGVATVAVGMLAASLLLSFPAAAMVGMLLALSPQLIVLESYLLSETVYAANIALLCLAVAAGFRSTTRRGRSWSAIVTGGLLGLSLLIRPTLFYLPVLLLLAVVLLPRLRQWRLAGVLAVMAAALVYSPWAVHNLRESGRISDPALAIATLQGGSYPGFVYNDDPATFGRPIGHDPRTPEISRSSRTVLAEIARKFAENPSLMLGWYALGKPWYFLGMEEVAGWGWVFVYPVLESPFLSNPTVRAISALMTGLHWPVVLLSIFGILAAWHPAWTRGLPPGSAHALRTFSILYLFVIAIHVVGTPLPRYAVPFRPVATVLAVFVLFRLGAWVLDLRRRSREAAGIRPRPGGGRA
jgi:4-amino-4-deoxy-L-arabinose transferase-like glycosyltransferase